MTFDELSRTLDAWCIVLPNLRDQEVFDVKITDTGDIRFSLTKDTVNIKVT